jgi:hypothetical protein
MTQTLESVLPASNGKLILPSPLRLDLGCGKSKRQDNGPWWGVDAKAFDGVDQVVDLIQRRSMSQMIVGRMAEHLTTDFYLPWPWDDASVDEAHASHVVEHFHMSEDKPERIHFVNELWRILKVGAKATIIVPHWCSERAYGDYQHKWPPCSEFWTPYLDRAWREAQVPHLDLYTCNFVCVSTGYTMRPDLMNFNEERRIYAMTNHKGACLDLIWTWEKRA